MAGNTRSTKDYTMFSFLVDNRQTARNHINKLKSAIRQNPEILDVQPILVNEKMEIIDGQHRFMAASELNLPITYTMVKGLDINTARDMNVLQKQWTVDDYAMSYAKAGNENYAIFNQYRNEYPHLGTYLLIAILSGSDNGSVTGTFRNGKFVVERDLEDVEWILNALYEVRDATGHDIPISKAFGIAFVQAINNDDFNYTDFINNLRNKPEMFHRTPLIKDALRMIEDIHNYKKSTKQIRLY